MDYIFNKNLKIIRENTIKIFLLVLLINVSVFAQLSTPTPEAVYGGRINAITSIPLNSTQTRVFVAAESANSIFYADMTTADTSVAPTFGTFTVMPGVGDDCYGNSIQKMSAHRKNSSLFFVTQSGDLVVTDSSVSTGLQRLAIEVLVFTERNGTDQVGQRQQN